jgi:hypothetical protein
VQHSTCRGPAEKPVKTRRARGPVDARCGRACFMGRGSVASATVYTVSTVSLMTSKPKGKQVPISGYYDPDTVKRLQRLTEVTRVPQAVYLREALADLLGKYASVLRKTR